MFLQVYHDENNNRTMLDNNTSGFDISAYRKVNRVHLLMGNPGEQFVEIFSAYYKGSIDISTSLETGAFGVDTVNFMNQLASNPITRSVLQSVTSSLLQESMSGSFAADYRPYIKSVSPMQWSVPCFLPLMDEDGDGDFEKNIEIPLNTLHRIYLPTRNTVTDKIKQTVSDAGNTLLDAIFSGTQGIAIFDAIQKAWKDLASDLGGDVIQLNNPVQFDWQLNLWIGEKICIENVILQSVKIGFSPLMYIDENDNVYPAYATVDLQFMSKQVATYEYAKLSDNYNSNLKNLLGE